MIERNTFGNLRRNLDVENDLSKMALKNSSNEDLKKFAHQVISENHSLSNELIIPNPNGDTLCPGNGSRPDQKGRKADEKDDRKAI